MKILLLVQDWISFYNQAEALTLGLDQIKANYKIMLIGDIKKREEVYRDFKPDVVVGIGSWHKYKEFVEEPLSKGIKALPWIVSDDAVEDYINGYNRLKIVATTSNYCREIFVRDGIKIEKLKVLPEAVDHDFWKKTLESQEKTFLKMISVKSNFKIGDKYDLLKAKKEGIPILLTMGGDVTSKGSQEILKALNKIDKKIKWFYLLKAWPQEHTFVRGQEEYRLIKELGLEERVRYMVVDFSREFVRDLINICDIYVAPSRSEGFGLPFVQAELCEKPIISIEALSVVDVVANKKTGFLVKPVKENGILKADIDELAKYLDILIKDKKLRNKMGKEGRSFAIKNFSPELIATRLVEYINLLD